MKPHRILQPKNKKNMNYQEKYSEEELLKNEIQVLLDLCDMFQRKVIEGEIT
jgi:hypothetical protein